jgi:hypothetical protein
VGEERHGGVCVRRHGDAGMSKDKRSKDKRRHAISSPLPAPRVDNQSMSVAGTLVVVLAVLHAAPSMQHGKASTHLLSTTAASLKHSQALIFCTRYARKHTKLHKTLNKRSAQELRF